MMTGADPKAALEAIWHKNSPRFNVKFSLAPDGNFGTRGLCSAPWYAALLVNTDDIPRLMREGLNFTETNVCDELGAVCPNSADNKGRLFWSPKLASKGFKERRMYFLTHLPAEGEPFWTAALLVFGKDLVTLSNFRVGDISFKMVYQCTAVNRQKELVYSYYSNPKHCFNAIYDGLLLKGIWPGQQDTDAYHCQEEGQNHSVISTAMSKDILSNFQVKPPGSSTIQGKLKAIISGVFC